METPAVIGTHTCSRVWGLERSGEEIEKGLPKCVAQWAPGRGRGRSTEVLKGMLT